MKSVAFQSILRKRIRKLPKFLKILKIIQFYSILFNRVLRRFAARFGACGGGEAGWTPAPRVQLPWDQLVFLEQFRGEEVLQAVDRAAVLEVAQEIDVLGIAGAPTAQELVAALQLSELGRLMAYPVPRSRGPRF